MKHLLPTEALTLVQQQPDALFIDVRKEIESKYVGRPPGVVNIAWAEYPTLKPDPGNFVAAVDKLACSKDQTLVLICRSGERTVDAGIALEKAGYTQVVNVLEGFEGDLDDNQHRGTESGWRFDGLPWTQS